MRPLAVPGGFGDWDEDDDEAPVTQRETMPVPRESGIRLQVSRVPGQAATVDVVVCDLTRDPRSDDYSGPGSSCAVLRVALVQAPRRDQARPARRSEQPPPTPLRPTLRCPRW